MECNPRTSCSSTKPFRDPVRPLARSMRSDPVLSSGRVQSSTGVVFALTRRAVNIDVPRNCCLKLFPWETIPTIAGLVGRLRLRFAATEWSGQFYRYCSLPFLEHGTFPPNDGVGWIWMITERFFRRTTIYRLFDWKAYLETWYEQREGEITAGRKRNVFVAFGERSRFL